VHIGLSFRVKDYLGQTFSVAKVDEYEIAVITIGMDPSGQDNLFPGVIEPKLSTRMRSFKHRRISLKLLVRDPSFASRLSGGSHN